MAHLIECVLALTLCCLIAQATEPDVRGVIIFRGAPSWMEATIPSTGVARPLVAEATSLYTIYSNLGPPTSPFNNMNGWIVSGPDTRDGEEHIAMPFTPKYNSEVMEIKAAVQFQSGENGVTISLNEDTNGLPGNALHTWNLSNLPRFGGCCKLDVVKDGKGLKVEQGKQYWLVATTNTRTERTIDSWDYTYKSASGSFAANFGTGWDKESGALSAFGIFGQKTE